jgi:hypothetical protein
MRVSTLRTIALTVTLATTSGACENRDPSHDTPPPEVTRAVGPVARDASRDRPVRRLSNAEISASLAVLLRAQVVPREGGYELESPLTGRGASLTEHYEYPPDPDVGGFDNNADALSVSPEFLSRHLRVVESLVADAVEQQHPARTLVACDAPADDACVRRFILRFGERAYRRPLAPEEFESLFALARAEPRARHAWLAPVVAAALMSPAFLYHMATGPTGEGGAQRLSGYDVADRLAFLLWGTLPDEGLLDAAARGELDTADGVSARAARMLADARARDGVQRFAERCARRACASIASG